jgi:hypothetical protein
MRPHYTFTYQTCGTQNECLSSSFFTLSLFLFIFNILFYSNSLSSYLIPLVLLWPFRFVSFSISLFLFLLWSIYSKPISFRAAFYLFQV